MNDKPMSEVKEWTDKDGTKHKVFTMKRRDGTYAEFPFDKPKGSVWYLAIPHKGEGAAIPFPDLDVDNCKSLKNVLDGLASIRSDAYSAQIYMGFMYPKSAESDEGGA
jgi:hypothetical protein